MSQAHSLSDTAKRMDCPSHILTFHAVTSLADVLSAVGGCLSARTRACTRGQPTTRKASCYPGGLSRPRRCRPSPLLPGHFAAATGSLSRSMSRRVALLRRPLAPASLSTSGEHGVRAAALFCGWAWRISLPYAPTLPAGHLEDKAGGFVPQTSPLLDPRSAALLAAWDAVEGSTNDDVRLRPLSSRQLIARSTCFNAVSSSRGFASMVARRKRVLFGGRRLIMFDWPCVLVTFSNTRVSAPVFSITHAFCALPSLSSGLWKKF